MSCPGVRVIRLGINDDPRGRLTVGEVGQQLPFAPARYFTVSRVPQGEVHGEHAHRQCHRFLVSVHGSCSVIVEFKGRRAEICLDPPEFGLHIPPMVWGIQYKYSPDAVLLVVASHGYETSDDFRNYAAWQSADSSDA
jgi:UDP-2-acetamido-3-amino-2,3-dideoxy-glucuronate N-acetyltransferase